MTKKAIDEALLVEPLIDIAGLARWLGVGRGVAYSLVASGSVPSCRIGERVIRIRPEAVRRWLAEQEGAAQGAST